MSKKILILNGPNLNMLGLREPEIYGKDTLADAEALCIVRGEALGYEVVCKQSNYEGDLVTWIQEAREDHAAIIINAGAYTHTSIAIHDALKICDCPIYEVHVSDVTKREAFRQVSYITPVAKKVICGHGIQGYVMAIEDLASVS